MPMTYMIRGQVRTPNQRIPGLAVRAFGRDMRSEEFLGQDGVAADGSFEIGYTADQFRRAEKPTADLLLSCASSMCRAGRPRSSAVQHRASILQDLLHPKVDGRRVGGFFHWGHIY